MAKGVQAPREQRIATDEFWLAGHAFGTALPGWLVLVPRRHVTALADLTDAEAAGLGSWQVRLSRALHAVLRCEKTYVAQFAEAEGFSHVHFHLIPRAADLPPELRGPRVFQLLGQTGAGEVPGDQAIAIADALATWLAGHPAPAAAS